jgi:hypothetical protein
MTRRWPLHCAAAILPLLGTTVFENEPAVDPRLLELENVVLMLA